MEARIERSITPHMMGDWGIANLHRICGWISAELWRRSPSGSKFATWAGRGGTDTIEAILDGEVQIAYLCRRASRQPCSMARESAGDPM